MTPRDKPLVWLHGEIKTPPFSQSARLEAGFLLRRLQQGENLAMPLTHEIVYDRREKKMVGDAGLENR